MCILDMLDIFDEVAPTVQVAVAQSRKVTWAIITHRLTAPFVFLLVCMVTLAACSASLKATSQSLAVCTISSDVPSTLVSVHAYPVPLLRVISTALDLSTVAIHVTGASPVFAGDDDAGKALYRDVQLGMVNTVFVGGTTWRAQVHKSISGALSLSPVTIQSFPLPILTSETSTWVNGWGLTGASTLVIAFLATNLYI